MAESGYGSYIGSTINLLSHSDIRYEGVLTSIDTEASTLTLQNGAFTTRLTARAKDQPS
jgi:hypothetical protein